VGGASHIVRVSNIFGLTYFTGQNCHGKSGCEKAAHRMRDLKQFIELHSFTSLHIVVCFC